MAASFGAASMARIQGMFHDGGKLSKELNEYGNHNGREAIGFFNVFSWGFYCTDILEQASRWASRRSGRGIVSIYSYAEKPDLNILCFPEMTDEWLDFITECRAGKVHGYDIVEGPMADDTIWNYVEDYISGDISRSIFWELARFKHPTHQISFHTLRALECLTFIGGIEADGGKIKE